MQQDIERARKWRIAVQLVVVATIAVVVIATSVLL
jgi:hypothetical protein